MPANGDLLERVDALAALGAALVDAGAGNGRLLLLGGEAGAGKTALLRRFTQAAGPAVRVLWGACDPLVTPRPLGPFHDIAEQLPGAFADLVRQETRPPQMVHALLRDLSAAAPAIAVLEDLHWADEASIDLLELAGRRIEQAPVLIVGSFRDDEVDSMHPLRLAFGRLATVPAVTRVAVPPLSLEAVTALCQRFGADGATLFDLTGGNPFFVTEVLSCGAETIPATVRDAVLARAARAGPGGVRLLQALAVLPSAVPTRLLSPLTGSDAAHLDRCLACGVLVAEDDRIRFRHELARLAVEEAIPPARRASLHRAVLRAYRAGAGDSADPAQLAHHAEQAGDAAAVLIHAAAAGDRAAAVGAHREAAAQYARALRFAGSAPADASARLHDRYSYECYLSDQPDEAVLARRQAMVAYRALGDRRREGESLCWLARLHLFASRDVEAEAAARDAIGLLESLPASAELAMAYSTLSYMRVLAGRGAEAISLGQQAIAVAERLGVDDVLIHALNNVGSAQFSAGLDQGQIALERSLELAKGAGLTEHVVRAYVNLASTAVDRRRYEIADGYLREGIGYAADHGVDAWRWYLLAVRARAEFERGRWGEAADTGRIVLAVARPTSFARLTALLVTARIMARRGEPGYWPLLDEAAGIAALNGHLQLTGPAAAGRAEAAWLDGRWAAVPGETREALDLARQLSDAWILGELTCWRRRAGVDEQEEGELAEPFALQVAGKMTDAAHCWLSLGCPYEAALAFADDGTEAALRRSLDLLHGLGARAAAAIVVRKLRALGARGLPRGPRQTTARNPAGLTDREVEVLGLLAEGLGNAEIAARLTLSPKTAEHHVSAILRKLGAGSRHELRNLGAAPAKDR